MKIFAQKTTFLIFGLLFLALLILPISAYAETGNCVCNFETGNIYPISPMYCENIAHSTKATCDKQTGPNVCTCRITFPNKESKQCSGDIKTIFITLGGTSPTFFEEYTMSGSCTFSKAEEPSEPGAAAPGRVELQPPFGQKGESGVGFIQEIIGVVINWTLGIVGSIALLMFVAGGFIWLTSAGNTDKIKRGRDIIVWSVIGLAAIFASYAISRVILEALLG